MDLLKGMILGGGEGNISWYPERMRTLQDLVSQTKPKNINKETKKERKKRRKGEKETNRKH